MAEDENKSSTIEDAVCDIPEDEYITEKIQSKTEKEISSLDVIDIIKNKTKFQIYNLFEIYGKFTLTDLTEKLGKSKSTVFKHLKDFMDVGILQMTQIEKTVKHKCIRENEYEFSDNYEEILETSLNPKDDLSKPLSKEAAKVMMEGSMAVSKRIIWFLEQQIEFYKKLLESGPDEEARNILFDIVHSIKDKEGKPYIESQQSFRWEYITQADLNRYRKHMKPYQIKEMKKGVFPILYLNSSIPIKKIIEYSLNH